MKIENTTKAPAAPTTTVAPTTKAPESVTPSTTVAPTTTKAPETSLSAMTDDINELTNPAAKVEDETKETKAVEAVEDVEVVVRRRTKKVEIMEPMNTDFPIYNESKRRR